MTLRQPELNDDDPRLYLYETVYEPERGGWYPAPEPEEEN